MSGLPKDQWVWMPHAAHFICADRCAFHRATYVGNWIVSTVGEMSPSILASPADKRRGFEKINATSFYETMVFRAEPSENECCPYQVADWGEVDGDRYMNAADAEKGHLALCEKWSIIDPQTLEVEKLEQLD